MRRRRADGVDVVDGGTETTLMGKHRLTVSLVVAAWLSGSALVLINKVTLCWAQLVLGLVTVCG